MRVGQIAPVTGATASVEPSLLVSVFSVAVLAVLIVLDLSFIRNSRRQAAELGLPKGQWLRRAAGLVFDPAFEFFVVAVLLADDIAQNAEHAVAAVAGAAVGLVVGHYRVGITYVRAVPDLKSIVFVRSRAEFVALSILVLVRIAAEQHRVPVVGPLTLLVTFLLALVLFESVGRSWFSYRRYRRDSASDDGLDTIRP